MVNNRLIISILFAVVFQQHVNAQDIHFSVFDMSPLTLNPAHTGNMQGDRRISNIYRNQWKALGKPLETFAAGYDQRLYFLPGNIGAGIVFLNDKSGGIELTENKILFSTAAKFYKGINSLSVGAQFGFCTKFLSLNDVTFPQQYNRDIGQFDLRLFNGEYNPGLKVSYFDFNAGLLFNHPTEKGELQIGAAVFHLNQPDDSFMANGDGLKTRYSINTRYTQRLSDKWYIRPSLLLMTLQKAQDLLFNALAGVELSDNDFGVKRTWFGMAVRTGINRNGDAAIPMAGLEFNFIEVAMAYDVNFSELQVATNNRGAFEVSLIYTGRSTAIDRRMIPCERY